jgi:hypothetical protein
VSEIGTLIAEAEERLADRLDKATERLEKKVDTEVNDRKAIVRQRNLALAASLVCLVAAIIGAILAITSREALHEQVDTNQIVLCGQGRSTALAFRRALPGETRDHFVNRMVAQRATLLALGGLRCAEQRGFATFPYLRGKALAEIDEILREKAPRRFRELVEAEHRGEGEAPVQLPPPSTSGSLPPPGTGPVAGPPSPTPTHEANPPPDTDEPPDKPVKTPQPSPEPGSPPASEPEAPAPGPGGSPPPDPEPAPGADEPDGDAQGQVVEVEGGRLCVNPVVCIGGGGRGVESNP